MTRKNILKSTLVFSLLLCGAAVSCSNSSSSSLDVNFKVPEGGFDTSKDVNIKFYTTMGASLQGVFNAFLETLMTFIQIFMLMLNLSVDTKMFVAK